MKENKEGFKEFGFEDTEESSITDREKALLWPILEALGVGRKRWGKFKYFPDQLTGLAISCVKERNRKISDLQDKVIDLQKNYARVCQINMEFRGCPLLPKEKS